MNIDELLKKRLLFFFISFIFIVVVTVSSSYALINSDVNKGKVINNGNLKIVFKSGDDEVLNSGYPMSYQQGMKDSPSNIIKIKNLSTSKTKFALYIRANDIANSLDVNKIYYSINNSKPNILGSVIKSNIYSDEMNANDEYVLDIKVWASSELINNSDQGKEIELVFEVKEID